MCVVRNKEWMTKVHDSALLYEDAPLQMPRWKTWDEFAESTTKINLCSGELLHRSGVPLSTTGDTAFIDDSERHVLVIGGTGTYKSTRLILPMLAVA